MTADDNYLKEMVAQHGGFRPASRFLRSIGFDIGESTLRFRLGKLGEVLAKETPVPFSLEEELPESGLDIDDLINRRIAQFRQKQKAHAARRIIPVNVHLDGPIGLGFMGDPHVDDDGTDLEEVFAHTNLFDGRTEGLYGACIGDVWNNWQGRLARLWAEQSTSSAEARALVIEFLTRVQWLFVIFGNHDMWAGKQDLLTQILNSNAMIKENWKVRVGLKFPSGRNLKILAAHGFSGRSQWSTVFGASKTAQLDGTNNIYVGGHIHVSGYTHGYHDGNQKMWHAVQVASYKKVDRYAEELNLPDNNIYTCPVALIDPYASKEVNFIRWEFDPYEGAERLKWMRARFNAGKSAS
jgi:hypothetical protein